MLSASSPLLSSSPKLKTAEFSKYPGGLEGGSPAARCRAPGRAGSCPGSPSARREQVPTGRRNRALCPQKAKCSLQKPSGSSQVREMSHVCLGSPKIRLKPSGVGLSHRSIQSRWRLGVAVWRKRDTYQGPLSNGGQRAIFSIRTRTFCSFPSVLLGERWPLCWHTDRPHLQPTLTRRAGRQGNEKLPEPSSSAAGDGERDGAGAKLRHDGFCAG